MLMPAHGDPLTGCAWQGDVIVDEVVIRSSDSLMREFKKNQLKHIFNESSFEWEGALVMVGGAVARTERASTPAFVISIDYRVPDGGRAREGVQGGLRRLSPAGYAQHRWAADII